MSLTTALGTARSSLFNTSRQTSVVSQNIANAQNPDYNKRTAVLISTAPGARVAEIQRAANDLLYRQNSAAISGWEGQSTLLTGLSTLGLSVNGADNATSPATLLGEFQTALQLYSASPSNRGLGVSAIEAARSLANAVNAGSNAVQNFRAQTDQQIGSAVNELNDLLSRLDTVNDTVVAGTSSGKDVSEALDERDAIVKQISQFLPVSTLTRGNDDLVVMTTGGTMLFETSPRTISFDASVTLAPGIEGSTVVIDGVPLGGPSTEVTGRLSALVQLRDGVATTMQSQLDEIARSLVATFAETDPSGAQPPLAGLFDWAGGPDIPPDGTLVPGMAGSVKINAAYDPLAGGNPQALRDGGANGAVYLRNTTGGAGYSDLLLELQNRMETTASVDPAAGAGDSLSLASLTTTSINWFEGLRQDASRQEEVKNALMTRTGEALSNATGVNIDEEMAKLLELEHSYQAAARLITAVDEMLAALMSAVR